ncbi:hypothetical protein ACFOZ0_27215 [Streptomyces yaanensis]|uniref:Aminodeoxyfutalosine deaminase/Imidazolonepropionase-like composite domain-containing protein n=1 Tax=Streptomyces yaanensis TaxID=1142239 RepID=A0ABV7SJQ8_9ACTN|nr:hypothetical protein [Streptomyces sp. CGMCC 4.7035]WNB97087.1 hypothetical protein Q2K21_02800 [Streptomyces sp. CGMCC 4.7035]
MLTIHAADELRYGWDEDQEPVKDGAVAVAADRVVGSGPLAELREEFPDARVRRWPGVLGPALLHQGPLPDAPTPRERIHAVLKLGATAVLEEYADTPELRAAAARNDVIVVPRGTAVRRPAAFLGIGRADLAVFEYDETGGGTCVATVCAGRLVHRRR